MQGILYLIANSRLTGKHQLGKIVAQAVEGGVDYVQLREKGRPADEIYRLAKELKGILDYTDAVFLVNDRVDVALAVGAHGVHLGQASLPPEVARKILGDDKIIGVSTHSLEEAQDAEKSGANYIIFSHIFPTESKPGRTPKGPESLWEISHRVEIPVVALGGINVGNVSEIVRHGVNNAAVMSSILQAQSPSEVSAKIKILLS